jgi:uncharacterized membrane protein
VDTTVDEAFKMIFTLGVITPAGPARTSRNDGIAPPQPPS